MGACAGPMTFLEEPAPSAGQERLYAADLAEDGYVWDLTRLWAHQAELEERLGGLVDAAADAAGLTVREKAVIVIRQAATVGDSYCSYAWGRRLTAVADAPTAVAALEGDDGPFGERERALAAWAGRVAVDPSGSTPEEVQRLRDVGFSDVQIAALTLYVGLRVAYSSINSALGARPDDALARTLDPAVRAAITWGRAPG